MRLVDIVRAFGVEPDAIRFIRRRYNTHWRVRAGERRYVLRRFGGWKGPDDRAWELAWVRRLADVGFAAPAPIGPLREIDGASYILMPFMPGRALFDPSRGKGHVSDARYRQVGRCLAEYHAAVAALAPPAQRPGCPDCVSGALPPGGSDRRAELLAAFAREDAALAARFGAAAEALEARRLPALLSGMPRIVIHADVSPWNVRMRRGQLVGLIDFELAHVDVRAADVAASRRGSHDAVVEGYCEVAPLTDTELGALDGLWLGGILGGLWRVLEDRLAEGSQLSYGLDWDDEQLVKTRPYGVATRV